jgi:hypothetical protein
MKAELRLLLASLALGTFATTSLARPQVIIPSATLENPEPQQWMSFGGEIASNGEYLLVLGAGEGPDFEVNRAAFLYRRVQGSWQYQGVLDQSSREYDSYYYPNAFDFDGDLAVVELDGAARAWRLTDSGWQPGPLVGGPTVDLELDGEAMVYGTGDCNWDGVALDPAAGTWVPTALRGQPRGCDDEFWGGEVDRLGDFIVLGTAYTADLEPQEAPVFERTEAGWQRRTTLLPPEGARFSGAVALVGSAAGMEAILDAPFGAYSYSMPWGNRSPHRLQATDTYAADARHFRDSTIESGGGFVFLRERSADQAVFVINAYRGDHASGYQHVAVLMAERGVDLNRQFDVTQTPEGLIVLATGGGAAYEFRIPDDLSLPSPRYEDFEEGAGAWQPSAGSQFGVVTEGSNRVFRQSNDAGDALALLADASWQDQSIEADVTPLSFNGSDRWVGLVTRYQDARNHYYVTLRSSGSVQLRRMTDGVFTELARAPVTVTPGTTYRLRLQSVGSQHRVYVNDVPLLDVDDATLSAAGQAGVRMYRTRADVDNVVVTPSPFTTLFANDFSSSSAGAWTFTGSGQWQTANGVYAQNSVGAEARALTGTSVRDQVVRARIRPMAYAAASGTQERWTGLLARYVDDSNYYYVTLRSSQQLSLRKLVNGRIFTLGTVSQPVALGTSLDVRLEAVGDQLRVFVDGRLRLQVRDQSHAQGRGGLMTYKAAAQFDDYLAYQP